MTVLDLFKRNLEWGPYTIAKIYDPDEISDECILLKASIIYRDREVTGFYTSKDGRAIISLKSSK